MSNAASQSTEARGRKRVCSAWQVFVGVVLAVVLALGSLGAAGCSASGSDGASFVDALTSAITRIGDEQAAGDSANADAGTGGTSAGISDSSGSGSGQPGGTESSGSGADSTTSGDVPSAATVPAEEFLARVPAYTGSVYTVLDDNEPSFTANDATTDAFEQYAPLDRLGRCGSAYACLGTELMPTEERESISEVHPTGWHSSRYDFVDGESLYNRSHLIAFQLAGENANERNLITGTRYLNADGMRPFEEMVGDYIRQTGNHVLYRVTPVFVGDELVARGVQMEARSMEDGGAGISLNVYIYNVQPGVGIDYATGDNWELDESEVAPLSAGESGKPAAEGAGTGTANVSGTSVGNETRGTGSAGNTGAANANAASANAAGASDAPAEPRDYVLNTSSRKFHNPSCDAVETISAANRTDVHESRADLIAQGYAPCGSCNP